MASLIRTDLLIPTPLALTYAVVSFVLEVLYQMRAKLTTGKRGIMCGMKALRPNVQARRNQSLPNQQWFGRL